MSCLRAWIVCLMQGMVKKLLLLHVELMLFFPEERVEHAMYIPPGFPAFSASTKAVVVGMQTQKEGKAVQRRQEGETYRWGGVCAEGSLPLPVPLPFWLPEIGLQVLVFRVLTRECSQRREERSWEPPTSLF